MYVLKCNCVFFFVGMWEIFASGWWLLLIFFFYWERFSGWTLVFMCLYACAGVSGGLVVGGLVVVGFGWGLVEGSAKH